MSHLPLPYALPNWSFFVFFLWQSLFIALRLFSSQKSPPFATGMMWSTSWATVTLFSFVHSSHLHRY